MLELKNVSKFYYSKGLIASGFTKVNLKLDMGEFVAITGESGSGKSTLLNVISGLDSYEEGEMYINGNETSHYSEKDFEDFRRKYISNIFQTFNLVNSYTVYQNIELVLLLNGYKKKDIRKKVLELIKKVDLYKFKNTKVSKLSGGQKQRVAIARALAKETPIIIADEPTGNLDKDSSESVIKLLSEVAKDKLVVIVTHNYEQIEKYVTRKITMHDGRIIEDKKIKQVSKNIQVNEVQYKNISKANRLRLGIRNTFNIKTKFILLFLVFIFLTVAIISQYANSKKQKYLAKIDGVNYLFQDTSDNRIIIKKASNEAFTEEDFALIETLDNIESIVKNDLLLDSNIELTDGQNLYIYGRSISLENFKGIVDVGRMPENDYEIIIEGTLDSYYIQQIAKNIDDTTVYLTDMYTGVIEENEKIKIVGLKYEKESGMFSYYGNPKIYMSDTLINKLRFIINQNYSTIRVLFLENYYESTQYGQYFRIEGNSNVPEGLAYVSRDLNDYTTNGSCINRPIKIELENIYYNQELELKIAKTYSKNNIKSLLGINDYDRNNGTIYISTVDYNKLFDKPTYQSTVFIKDAKKAGETAKNLQDIGLKTLIIQDTLVNNSLAQVMEIFQTVVTIVLIITLFFISYFIIRIILKSRNTYYATLRMLGANRKICKQLIIIELLIIANLAYIIFGTIILLQANNIINKEFVKTIIDYLKSRDYIILYVILNVMSYMISLKFAKKLFKDSSMKTFKEEV